MKIRKCSDCGCRLGKDDIGCPKCGFRVIEDEKMTVVEANNAVENAENVAIDKEKAAGGVEEKQKTAGIKNNGMETPNFVNIIKEKILWSFGNIKELWAGLDLFMKILSVSAILFLIIIMGTLISGNGLLVFVLMLPTFFLICAALKHKGIITAYDVKIKYVFLIFAWILCLFELRAFSEKPVKEATTETKSYVSSQNNEPVITDITIPFSASECEGQNYNDIGARFVAAGFKDIVKTEVADLGLLDCASNEQIEYVEINGVRDFSKDDVFKSDSRVEIKYHVIKRVGIPVASNAIADIPVDELRERLIDAGFVDIVVRTVSDIDPDKEPVEFKNEMKAGTVSTYKTGDLYPLDTTFEIINHVPYAKYDVIMHVDFISNLLFNKYKVAVFVDGSNQGTLGHGEDKDISFRVKEGTYKIKFAKEEDTDVKGDFDLKVAGNIEMTVQIGCESDYVKVEITQMEDAGALADDEVFVPINDKDVVGKDKESLKKLFEDAGLTNVKTEPIYDIDEWSEAGELGDVTVNNSNIFKKGDVVKKDVAVLIKYHEKKSKDPVQIEASKKIGELDKTFPKELAIRTITVAMTNGQATDVYKSDGNTLNPSKFHSYDDIDGFFITVVDEGKWNTDDDSWVVENMMFRFYEFETYMRVSAKVRVEDDKYIVYNVFKTIATKEEFDKEDLSKRYTENLEPSEDNLYLTVPYSLIEKDRDKAKEHELISYVDKHKKWVEDQFHWWDGRHTRLCQLVEKKLDAKSFRYEEATWIDVVDENVQKQVNDSLKKSGFSERVKVGDLFIIQEFSAKTKEGVKFNAKACGIVDYETDEVTLLGASLD